MTHDTLPGAPVPFPGEPSVSREIAREFGLTDAEWERVVFFLGRDPTYATERARNASGTFVISSRP